MSSEYILQYEQSKSTKAIICWASEHIETQPQVSIFPFQEIITSISYYYHECISAFMLKDFEQSKSGPFLG